MIQIINNLKLSLIYGTIKAKVYNRFINYFVSISIENGILSSNRIK